MKKFRVTALSIAAIVWCAGSLPVRAMLPTEEDDVGLSIVQTERATFPEGVLMRGVHSGRVRIVISVNAEGRLVDHLVVSYTNAAFVGPAVRAVKAWKYEPARAHGKPCASRVDLSFEFKSDLNVTVMNSDVNFLKDIFGETNEFQPCLLRDLDRIPTPVHVISPAIPPGVLAPGEERIVEVEFYIDQEGVVRVPAVSREKAGDSLAAAAVSAVEQWRFEPPLRWKKPALVLAQQQFRFVAKPNAP